MSPDDNGYHRFGKHRAHKWWWSSGLKGELGCWSAHGASRAIWGRKLHKTQALYISAPRQSVTTYFWRLSFCACFNKGQLIWLYKGARTGSGCICGGDRERLFEGRLATQYKTSKMKTGTLAPQYKELNLKTGRHGLPVGQSRYVTGISY